MMFRTTTLAVLAIAAAMGQTPAFEVASVRLSQSIVGRDGNVVMNPGVFTARNTTLKRLIFEAYQVPYSQITGGPGWLDTSEYEVEAKAADRASVEQLRLMLRTLLASRLKLTLHRETVERRVYELAPGKGGARLGATDQKTGPGTFQFHGGLDEFANVLAVQLTIPMVDDPTTPSRARGNAVPVVNKTGIQGEFDISLEIKPEGGADAFTIWQRALQEQLGLTLVARKGPVEILVIDHAEKTPTDN